MCIGTVIDKGRSTGSKPTSLYFHSPGLGFAFAGRHGIICGAQGLDGGHGERDR